MTPAVVMALKPDVARPRSRGHMAGEASCKLQLHRAALQLSSFFSRSIVSSVVFTKQQTYTRPGCQGCSKGESRVLRSALAGAAEGEPASFCGQELISHPPPPPYLTAILLLVKELV
ncbi:hypothetical protein ACMYSQ_007089 [Aspergillus niger]